MARHAGPRVVQCYHCSHRFEVSGRAQSTSCPKCNKQLQHVGDIVINNQRGPLRELRTCGRIIIKKRGWLIAEYVEAHRGIECQGKLHAKRIVSGRTMELGPKAEMKGDLSAPACDMQEGAKVLPSMFEVPSDPLELGDLPD